MAEGLKIFLATVKKVLISSDDFKELVLKTDYVILHNDNKKFDKKDARFLGAIEFHAVETENTDERAFPFDKNNMTFPIQGETVMIIKNADEYYWLPYTVTQYPNYRKDYKTTFSSLEKNIASNDTAKTDDYNKSKNAPNASNTNSTTDNKKYKVKEKIKFLKPKEGDTIIQGRVGNTIRFSESFLVSEENAKDPSPTIIIRNRQNDELDDKKIGELIEEDINKDGSSIYIVSKNAKVPYKHTTIEKQKVGFNEYPSDDKLNGDQVFINSGRIVLSAKANEFIIFGKKNTGIITDGNFSVDAAKDVYVHADKNITIHSKGSNKIYLNSDGGGKIYLGKDTGEGNAGADVQKMVLGGELVQILTDLITILENQMFLTPSGPTQPGPQPDDKTELRKIKGKLNTILSAKNFLSKS